MELNPDEIRRKRLEFFTKTNETKPEINEDIIKNANSLVTRQNLNDSETRANYTAYNYSPENDSTKLDSFKTNNKALNDFKKIVESSYAALNNGPQKKTETSATEFNNDLDKFFTENPVKLTRRSSHDLELSFRSITSVSSSNHDFDFKSKPLIESFRGTSCKIQFMSAYNIYEPENKPDEKPIDETPKYKKHSLDTQLSCPVETLIQNTDYGNMVEKNYLDSFKLDNDNKTTKTAASPRFRLRMYHQQASDEKSHSSSTSRSTPSPQHKIQQPHPPATRLNSTVTPRIVQPHEAKPPSTQRSGQTPTYRRKIVNKVSPQKPIANFKRNNSADAQQLSNRNEFSAHDISTSTKIDDLSDIVNNIKKFVEAKKESINSKSEKKLLELNKNNNCDANLHESKPNETMGGIPDLLRNCVTGANEASINETTKKTDNSKRTLNEIIRKADQVYDQIRPVNIESDLNKKKEASDDEDTLDNLSTSDSLKNFDEPGHVEKASIKPNQIPIMKINLDALSSDEDSYVNDKQNVNNYHENDDLSSHEAFNIVQSDTYRQTKPNFIPNLLLDNDDDKSVSVAASLAKSMCKEIDYKAEMETLAQHDFNANSDLSEQQVSNNNGNNLNLLLKGSDKLKFAHETYTSKIPTFNPNIKNLNLNQIYELKSAYNTIETTEQQPELQAFFLHKKPPIIQIGKSTVLNKGSLKARPQSSQSFFKEELIEIEQANVKPKSKIPQLVDSVEKFELGDEKKKKCRWESADICSKSNIKLNLFAANRNKRAYEIVSRPQSALQASRDTSKERDRKIVTLKSTSQSSFSNNKDGEKKSNLFLNFSKIHKIDIENSETRKQIFDKPLSDKDSSDDDEQFARKFLEKALNACEVVRQVDWCSLPHELWLNILIYLNQNEIAQFGRTCKMFYQIYSDRIFWKSIKIKNRHNFCDIWLQWIGRKQPSEIHLIECSGHVNAYTIVEMFKNIGPSLKTLNLSRCFTGSLSGDNMALQASIRCHNLRNLDLSWTLLSNSTLKLIVDSFKILESINLSGCKMITEDGMDYLMLKQGSNIKTLEIADCFHLDPNCIYNVGVYCSNLSKLNISNCHRMMNQSILESCVQWQKLEFLDVRGIKNIRNNCISQIVRKCPEISGLALANCLHLSDTAVFEIATYKPTVEYLDLKGCKKITDDALLSIKGSCYYCKFLDLSATTISDKGLYYLADSKLTECLEELRLSFTPISECALIDLVTKSPKLNRLHLYGCYNIKNFTDIKTICSERTSLKIDF